MPDTEQYVNNLRATIAHIITEHEVWTTLCNVLDTLNIQYPPKDDDLGKAKYLSKVTELADEKTIILAAKQLIKSYPGRGGLSVPDICKLQDNIWWIENNGTQSISKVSRHKIAACLENTSFWGRTSLEELLAPVLIPLDSKYTGETADKNNYVYLWSLDPTASLYDFITISKPIKLVPSRISTAAFFRNIGITDWPDQRLILVLERIVHPEVQDKQLQQDLVNRFNDILSNDSFEFRQEGIEGGSPVYKIRKKGIGVQGTPKYIIFASSGAKPDIIIPDTINMDIQVVKHADKCLIYDQTPTEGDLTWELLLNWWANKQGISHPDDKTRQEFGKRLRSSLQSDPERVFFDTYFKMVKPKYGVSLPALLPQVYLHYDPRSRNERGTPILVRQRMDFLLLLRNSARVVLEIDGMQHYADETLHASTTKYAEMVAEDRRIRLLGYEIYRFGVDEIKINNMQAQQIITTFFDDLFVRHKISPE